MPVGAVPPVANGDPLTDVSEPVAAFTLKDEIVLSTLLATKSTSPIGATATPKGCWPVAMVEVAGGDPLLMLKTETLLAATLDTNMS